MNIVISNVRVEESTNLPAQGFNKLVRVCFDHNIVIPNYDADRDAWEDVQCSFQDSFDYTVLSDVVGYDLGDWTCFKAEWHGFNELWFSVDKQEGYVGLNHLL